jgi:protocatechuate 3,4-dioxygenase, alpha subunit
MNSDRELVATASQTVGPFFQVCFTPDQRLGCMASPGAKGERIRLTVRVLDRGSTPLPDAMIELWQADANGKYDHPEDSQDKIHDPAFCGFGRMGTGADGSCVFETVRPGRVPGSSGVLQAPHINVTVFARGLLRHLWTRIYFAGDGANQQDAILNLVSESRRQTLLACPGPKQPGAWTFDIRLCGDGETVFFDM